MHPLDAPTGRHRLHWITAIVLVVAAVAAFVLWPRVMQPRRLTNGMPALPARIARVDYYSDQPNPFAGGKMWVCAWDDRHRASFYRLDIERDQIEPFILEGDQGPPAVLDEATGRELHELRIRSQGTFFTRGLLVGHWLARLGFAPRSTDDLYAYWLFPDRRARPVYLGQTSQPPVSLSRSLVSQGGQYCWISTSPEEQFVIDLKRVRLIRLPPAGNREAYFWSEHELLYADPKGDLTLFDLADGARRRLLSGSSIDFLAARFQASAGKGYWSLVPVWNGEQFDFYVGNLGSGTDRHWLARIARPGGQLNMVSANMPAGIQGTLDGTAGAYVYTSRANRLSYMSINRYDVSSGQTTALTETTANDPPIGSPRFYKDRVIYTRGAGIWMMNADGSGDRQIFPPPAPGARPASTPVG